MEIKEFHSSIVYRKQVFMGSVIYILVCLCLGLFSTYILKSKVVSICLVILILLRLLLLRLTMKMFTRKIRIQIDSTKIVSTIFGPDLKGSTSEFELRSLRTYSLQIPTDKFVSIKLFVDNVGYIEYSFHRNSKIEGDAPGDEIVKAFSSVFKKFNLLQNEHKIIFKPSFYASRNGLITIVSLVLFLVIGLAVAAGKDFKGISVSFLFGIILIIQLVIKRQNELKYFKDNL